MKLHAVGKPVNRVDARAKVMGAATYSAEFASSTTLHARLVVAPTGPGRLLSFDLTQARQSEGVKLVLTHENMPVLQRLTERGQPLNIAEMVVGERVMPLAGPEVQYAGQIIAVVVAETLEQATFAAEQVRFDLEPTPRFQAPDGGPEAILAAAVAAPVDAFYEEDLQVVGPPVQNSPAESMVIHARGDLDEGMAQADVVVSSVYTTPVETHCTMEMSGTIAEWTGDTLRVWDSTQWAQGVQFGLAKAFGLPVDDVVVTCRYVGGAFGSKAPIWGHQLLAAAAARECGAPVSLSLTRAENMVQTGHRPATVQRIEIGSSATGRLTAIRHESANMTGTTNTMLEDCVRSTSTELYACPNVLATQGVVPVSMSPSAWLRAPGEAPGSFAFESAIDELAYAVGVDPVELRILNETDVNPTNDMPWMGRHLIECFRRGAETLGWSRRDPAPRSMNDNGVLVGWGMATAAYLGFRMGGKCRVVVDRDGRVSVQTAVADPGTGSATVMSQMAADALGFRLDQIEFGLADSRQPAGWISGGSASTATTSEVLTHAGAQLRQRIADLAVSTPGSPLQGCPAESIVLDQGCLMSTASPASPEIGAGDLLSLAGEEELAVEAESGMTDGMSVTHFPKSFGAHFVEVRIDPASPRVQVSRVVSVMDIGRVVNPKTATGQVVGGAILGIGMAVSEELSYDAGGKVINNNLADYAIPVNLDVGEFDVAFVDIPDEHFNTLGVRGVGEIGTTGIAAAIANAVFHATGVRFRDLPITPEKLVASGAV